MRLDRAAVLLPAVAVLAVALGLSLPDRFHTPTDRRMIWALIASASAPAPQVPRSFRTRVVRATITAPTTLTRPTFKVGE